MLAPVSPAVTREDYEAMPPGPPYFQLIEGQLVMSPSPLTQHQRIVGRFCALLFHFTRATEAGEVFVAPLDVFLDDVNILQPDIAFVAKEHLGRVTDQGIEGAPDLCIEVLSKSTQRYDRITKRKVFAQSGLNDYWLADAETKTLTIYELRKNPDEPVGVLAASETFHPAIFPSLEIKLSEIFL